MPSSTETDSEDKLCINFPAKVCNFREKRPLLLCFRCLSLSVAKNFKTA